MICYKGTTFCSGGTPRCIAFTTCPKALTEDIQARAKAARLPISQYIAPTAMPCYAPPIATTGSAGEAVKRLQFRVFLMSEEQWRKEFEQEPQRPDTVIAKQLGCSTTSVRSARLRLGYPTARPLGITRSTIYTKADAMRLIAACKKTKGNLAAAGRSLGIFKNTTKHLRARFRDLFEAHGF